MNEEVNISELCRIIRDTVGDAVHKAADSAEVREIKETFKSVAREVADEFGAQVKQIPDAGQVRERVRRHSKSYTDDKTNNYVYKTPDVNKQPEPAVSEAPEVSGPPVWKGSPGKLKAKGSLMMVFGTAGALAGAGMLAVTAFAAMKLVSGLATALAWGAFGLIPFGVFAAFVAMARRGGRLCGMGGRYQKYMKVIGDDRFCTVKLLSEATGKSVRFVRKDMARMIKAGMFPEGQLDSKKETLILDADTYRHYLEAQQRMQTEQREAQRQEDGQKKDTELDATLTEGREYVRRIRLANDLISGPEITGKLDRIEQVGKRIFEHVEQHPEKLPDIRRFMSYYLPITLKLVEGYCKFDSQPVQGENIAAAKKEIEDTLDTITLAFENLLDGLFQREAMDISSDISALEAMLAQEGLTGSDFKRQPNEQ